MIHPITDTDDYAVKAITLMVEAEREDNDALNDLVVQHYMSMEDTDNTEKGKV